MLAGNSGVRSRVHTFCKIVAGAADARLLDAAAIHKAKKPGLQTPAFERLLAQLSRNAFGFLRCVFVVLRELFAVLGDILVIRRALGRRTAMIELC